MNFNRLDLTTHFAVPMPFGFRIWLPAFLLLMLAIFNPLSSFAQRPSLDDPESYRKINAKAIAETERIQQSSAKELTEILSRPEEFIRFNNNTVTGLRDVSVWWTAIEALVGKMDKARPFLKKMLSSSEESTRWNALLVLQRGDPADLRKLKKEYLRLLNDPETRFRAMGYRILGKIGDKNIENRMLRDLNPLLDKSMKSSGEKRKMILYEAKAITEGLCTAPVNKELVVKAVVSVLDHPHADSYLLSVTIQESAPLSRLPGLGDDLLAAYWRVIRDRSELRLAYGVMSVMEEKDPRTLPYLLQVAGLSDSSARADVYRELMRHHDFDMADNWELVRGMLHDTTIRARFAAVRNVMATPSLANMKAVFGEVLELVHHEPVPVVRQECIMAVLKLWERLGKEGRDQLDRRLRDAMATDMLGEMGGIYAGVVIRGTGYCLGEYWGLEDVPDRRKQTVAYWEEILAGGE